MRAIFSVLIVLALAGCGDPPPPPQPAAQPVVPQPVAPQAAAPEVKAPEAPKPDPNKELAARVKRALERDGKVEATQIDVTAADGRVSLWGTAATAADRARAGQVASKVEGVTSVDNKLAIVKGS